MSKYPIGVYETRLRFLRIASNHITPCNTRIEITKLRRALEMSVIHAVPVNQDYIAVCGSLPGWHLRRGFRGARNKCPICEIKTIGDRFYD